MYHTLAQLAARFDVDLLAPATEGIIEAQELLGSACADLEFVLMPPRSAFRQRLRFGPYERHPALSAALHRRLASGEYSAIHITKSALLPYLPPDVKIPLILDTWSYGLAGAWRVLRNEPGLRARALNLSRLVRHGLFDAFCWPNLSCVLVVSEVDRQRCLRQRPFQRVLVVPNGVDCDFFRPAETPPSRRVLLFTGNLSFPPNVEAAQILCREVFPAIRDTNPDVELHLVGLHPSPAVEDLAGSGVTIYANVPDMRPHLHSALIYVAPILSGAGTRTKLLEAMAAGLPIVTTPLGIEGLDAVHDHAVLLGNDSPSMVRSVRQLLSDGPRRQRLGSTARRIVEERYDWTTCIAPLTRLYRDLLG